MMLRPPNDPQDSQAVLYGAVWILLARFRCKQDKFKKPASYTDLCPVAFSQTLLGDKTEGGKTHKMLVINWLQSDIPKRVCGNRSEDAQDSSSFSSVYFCLYTTLGERSAWGFPIQAEDTNKVFL